MLTCDINELFTQHQGLIVSAVREHTPSRLNHERDDISQSAQLGLLEAIQDLKPGQPITVAWVYTVIRNHVTSEVRKLSKKRAINTEELEDVHYARDTSVDRAVEQLADAILDNPGTYLSPRQADAIRNHDPHDARAKHIRKRARKRILEIAAATLTPKQRST